MLARGFKITALDAKTYRNLLDFISMQGYEVSTNQGEITIVNLKRSKAVGGNSPAIFIDDLLVYSYDMLGTYNMEDIDEVYFNKSSYGYNGPMGTNGTIRIYTKKRNFQNTSQTPSQFLLVKNGFRPIEVFSPLKYVDYQEEGFQNFGVIDWKPNVISNSDGYFKFTIPNFYQKSIKIIIIEGMSADGEMISEIQTLDIP